MQPAGADGEADGSADGAREGGEPAADQGEDAPDQGFDAGLYLATNPDLARAYDAGLIAGGSEHWREAGREETRAGRRPSIGRDHHATEEARRALADAADARNLPGEAEARAYLAANPDLAAVYADDLAGAAGHLFHFGRLEGRLAPGDRPFAGRGIDLGAILARPFGIDLHLPLQETGPVGVAGRRLLAAIRAAGIPAETRCYDEGGSDRALAEPGLLAGERARPGTRRISLIVADPPTLRRLRHLHAPGHFDASYVVGFWVQTRAAPHAPDYASFGALDELWVGSRQFRDRLAASAPVPVRAFGLPAAPLPARATARRLLGIPAGVRAVMLDAAPEPDGQGGVALPACVEAALSRLDADDRSPDAAAPLLVLRATPAAMPLLDRALGGMTRRERERVQILADQRHQGGASLVLACCDAVVASDGIDADLADADAAGMPILEAATGDAPAPEPWWWGSPRAAARPPATADETGARILDLLRALDLDAEAPRFARLLGRARNAAVAAPGGAAGTPPAPGLPVLSVLLDGPGFHDPGIAGPGPGSAGLDGARIEAIADALERQPHQAWELCIGAVDPRRLPGGDRTSLRQDPRLRVGVGVGGGAAAVSRADALNAAAALATGDILVPVLDPATLPERIAALAAIAAALEESGAEVLVAADPDASATVLADSIEGGGPSAEPIAIRRATFERHRFRGAAAPALGLDLMLRLARDGAAIAPLAAGIAADVAADGDDPVRPGRRRHPAHAEAVRLCLLEHARARSGPRGFVTAGTDAQPYRVRRLLAEGTGVTVLTLAGAVAGLDAGAVTLVTTATTRDLLAAARAASTEDLILLDAGVASLAPGSVDALRELLADDGIGVAGCVVLHADLTLDHAGFVAVPGTEPGAEPGEPPAMRAVGRRFLPPAASAGDPGGRLRNVDAVSGCLAIRRSLLLELDAASVAPGLDPGDSDGFASLAALVCERFGAAAGRRIVCTPFARCIRAALPRDRA